PTASSASVNLRTFFGSPAISAMPPALSVTGPKASSATTMPASASIAVTAMAMPNSPACPYDTRMPAMITNAGAAVDSSEIARPWMTLVPWPVTDAAAIDFTGRKLVPVEYFVIQMISPVTTRPTIAQMYSALPVKETPVIGPMPTRWSVTNQ